MTVAGKKMEGFVSSSPMVTQQAVVGFYECVFCVWGRETRSYRFLRRGHLSTNFQRTKYIEADLYYSKCGGCGMLLCSSSILPDR